MTSVVCQPNHDLSVRQTMTSVVSGKPWSHCQTKHDLSFVLARPWSQSQTNHGLRGRQTMTWVVCQANRDLSVRQVMTSVVSGKPWSHCQAKHDLSFVLARPWSRSQTSHDLRGRQTMTYANCDITCIRQTMISGHSNPDLHYVSGKPWFYLCVRQNPILSCVKKILSSLLCEPCSQFCVCPGFG